MKLNQNLADVEMDEFLEKHFKAQEEKISKVSTKEYQEWLYSYINKNKAIIDDDFIYDDDSLDKENSILLYHFMEYIEQLAIEQRVREYDDDGYSIEYVFRMMDAFFRIKTMHGQGSVTMVTNCMEPDFAYVKIGNSV